MSVKELIENILGSIAMCVVAYLLIIIVFNM